MSIRTTAITVHMPSRSQTQVVVTGDSDRANTKSLACADPGVTVAEIRGALESPAKDLGATGRDDAFGHGLGDVAAFKCDLGNWQAVATLLGRVLVRADGQAIPLDWMRSGVSNTTGVRFATRPAQRCPTGPHHDPLPAQLRRPLATSKQCIQLQPKKQISYSATTDYPHPRAVPEDRHDQILLPSGPDCQGAAWASIRQPPVLSATPPAAHASPGGHRNYREG